MTFINLPSKVSVIIETLNNHGFDAYAVGGCIRDSLLGTKPHDWDICTSALPEQIISSFEEYRVIETGLQHGTVTVVIDSEPFEITTFRIDGLYSDNRHPDEVIFVDDIKKDLSRRDITINAMAYNDTKGLIDPFGGQKDLSSGILRCVGNPDDRFNEDALRIMRVLRFASVYGLEIEEKTEKSLKKNKSLLHKIAVERINKELSRLLMGKGAKNILLGYKDVIGEIIPQLIPCFDFNQNNKYHEYDVYTHMIMALDNYKGPDFPVVLSLFLHDIGKPQCYFEDETGGHFHGHGAVSSEIAKKILTELRFDNYTIETVSELIFNHDASIESTKKAVRRWLNRIGEEQFRRLLDIRKADILAHSSVGKMDRIEIVNKIVAVLDKTIEENSCFKLKDLAINGYDIMNLGIAEGCMIGKILDYLLDLVIEEKVKNEKTSLLEAAEHFVA